MRGACTYLNLLYICKKYFKLKLIYHEIPHSTFHIPHSTFHILLVFVFLIGNNSLFGQTFSCGTPDIPLSVLEDIKSHYPSSSSVAKIPVYKVPLWIYIVRDNNGQGSNFTPSFFSGSLPAINSWYNGVVQFTICGTTYIDKSEYFPLVTIGGNASALYTYAKGLNIAESEHCIRVFATNTLNVGTEPKGGYCTTPISNLGEAGVYIAKLEASTLAHELGHYFALPHTHQGGPSGQFVNYNCSLTGDGFCDTPADPGDNFCTFFGCVNFTCTTPTDPLGVAYQPDQSLIMSNYRVCQPFRFSDDQKLIMRNVFTINPTAYGNLITNVPEACLLPTLGYIERNCIDVNSSLPIGPLKNVKVELRNSANTPCTTFTGNDGGYQTQICNFTPNNNIRITPDKLFDHVNELNGLSVYDCALILQHVGGTTPLPTPFMMIAADVNNSQTITSFDAQLIRRVISNPFLYDLPMGDWRYISRQWVNDPVFAYQFNDGNPFDATITDPYDGTLRSYLNSASGGGYNSWMDRMRLNTSNPLGQQEDAWSFYAIKVGDVNCNGYLNLEPPSGDESTFAVPAGENTSVGNNQTKKFQVVANVSTPILAWQFGANFPANAINIQQISDGNTGTIFDPENFSVLEYDANNIGEFRSLWYSTDGTAKNLNNKVLFEFTVTGQSSIDGLENILKLDPKVLQSKFYDVYGNEISNVILTLKSSISTPGAGDGQDRSIASDSEPKVTVSPVPFSSKVNFKVSIPSGELVKISIFDQVGKLIVSRSMELNEGGNDFIIDNLSSIPSGVYYYKVEAGSYHTEGKLEKQ